MQKFRKFMCMSSSKLILKGLNRLMSEKCFLATCKQNSVYYYFNMVGVRNDV